MNKYEEAYITIMSTIEVVGIFLVTPVLCVVGYVTH